MAWLRAVGHEGDGKWRKGACFFSGLATPWRHPSGCRPSRRFFQRECGQWLAHGPRGAGTCGLPLRLIRRPGPLCLSLVRAVAIELGAPAPYTMINAERLWTPSAQVRVGGLLGVVYVHVGSSCKYAYA